MSVTIVNNQTKLSIELIKKLENFNNFYPKDHIGKRYPFNSKQEYEYLHLHYEPATYEIAANWNELEKPLQLPKQWLQAISKVVYNNDIKVAFYKFCQWIQKTKQPIFDNWLDYFRAMYLAKPYLNNWCKKDNRTKTIRLVNDPSILDELLAKQTRPVLTKEQIEILARDFDITNIKELHTDYVDWYPKQRYFWPKNIFPLFKKLLEKNCGKGLCIIAKSKERIIRERQKRLANAQLAKELVDARLQAIQEERQKPDTEIMQALANLPWKRPPPKPNR